MLEKVIENWTSRSDYIRASRGSPMPEIIFKIRHIKACYNCRQSLNRKSIRNLSKYNGIVYPEIPGHLSTLDLVSERLISPRIPFKQIGRLRHVLGQFGILGEWVTINCITLEKSEVGLQSARSGRLTCSKSIMWAWQPSGQGKGPVASLPLVLPSTAKDQCEGRRCTLNPSKFKSPAVAIVWKFGEGSQSSGVVLVACPCFKITRPVAN
ncbi:uncharacterized protein TNCV_2895851 [Trichonephila clavipes]|nr:uncharacterized protein TNCV_2895851 [Trichonephila clavipes]